MAETIGADFVSNPGSLSEFLERTGLENTPEAYELLSEELVEFRRDLAAARGISVEELHTSPLSFVRPECVRPVARIAISQQVI